MKKILTPFFFCFSLILLFPSCQPFLRGTAPHGRHPQQGGGNGGAGGSGGSNESGPANDKVGLNFQGDVITDLQYATNVVDYKGNKESLALDLYMPDKLKTGRKYPLYIFVHGGGFLRGDKRTGADFCKGLATKGFVAASINYRLGWSDAHTISNLCAGDSIELKK
ncbi:MAG: alpha/beta hydrolase, partial [Parafilimonas sp.]